MIHLNDNGFKANEEFMPCKFCDSTKASLISVSRKRNGGDNVIYPHVHLNFLYNCSQCHRDFLVRMYLGVAEYFKKLYYGDIGVDGQFMDMSPATQDELVKKGIRELKPTTVMEKSKTVRGFIEYIEEKPDALDYGFLDIDGCLQNAYDSGY